MTKERLRKIMGENIRNERVSRSMSIDELAELLELTSGFVGLIERGRRGATPYTLYKLSAIFDMDIDAFFAENFGSGSSLKVSEVNTATSKRKKVGSVIHDLSEPELDYIIFIIKGLKQMQNQIHGRQYVIDEDEDEGDA